MSRERVELELDDQLEFEPIEGSVGVETGSMSRAILSSDPETGAATYVLRVSPGFRRNIVESHPTEEEYVLLEGAITIGDRDFRAPAYMFLPKHAQHGPFQSKNGALFLNRRSGPRATEYHDPPSPWPRTADS
jgi:ChrR Cupin-like domain